jgi:citrate synthase
MLCWRKRGEDRMSSGLARGLEGVIAAETVLGWTDPAAPMIWVRGVPLPDLVARGFEAAVALLWDGFAGDGLTGPGIAASLGAARVAAFEGIDHLLANAVGQDPSDALRIGLARLDTTAGPVPIVGTLTVLVPALLRAMRGAPPVSPDPALSTAVDLLRMLHGSAPDVASAAALDTYFTAMMETGLNTSSFACRVVASTRASLAAAVLGAWCTFTGPLHGGAPGPTLDLLDEAAAVPDLDAWLTAKIEAGERLMGFGNRLFPKGHGDPRAVAMRAALERMGPAAGRFAFATKVEERLQAVLARIRPGRVLPANIEITAAILLDALRIPREGFTPVFAVGRCPSWIAHALEQQKTGRMYRPLAAYVGPAVGA